MDGVNFKVENFEGPLDLLLHLIEKHKIDIYDIPIAELTDSYLEYLSYMQANEVNMDNLSEFIVMAAVLIELKSRILLPPVNEDEKDEGDPRDELVRRLLEYRQFKEAASELGIRDKENLYPVFRGADAELKKEVLKNNNDKDISDILYGADGNMLYKAFLEVMNRREVRVDRVRSSFDSVTKDPFTVEDKTEHIKNVLKLKNEVEFGELFGRRSSKSEKITTFLAILELIKAKYIEVMQESVFGSIMIRKAVSEDEAKQ